MALSILTATAFNPPYGLDETQSRIFVRGKLVFSGTSGTYATNGLLPNFTSSVASVAGTIAQLLNESGQAVLIPSYSDQQRSPIVITGATVSGANVTLATANPPAVGQFVTLSGFNVAALTPLNGVTAQVTTSTPATSFVVAITGTAATTSAHAGQAMIIYGPDDMEIHSVAGSGYIYQYNKKFATVQILEVPASSALTNAAPLAEHAATTTASAVVSDTIHFVASWVKD